MKAPIVQMTITDMLAWLDNTGLGITLSGQISCERWPTLLDSWAPPGGEGSYLQTLHAAATVVEDVPYDAPFPNLTVQATARASSDAEGPSTVFDSSDICDLADGSTHGTSHTGPVPAGRAPEAADQVRSMPSTEAASTVGREERGSWAGVEETHKGQIIVRVDSEARLLRALHLRDKAELVDLLRQPWMVDAVREFTEGALDEYRRQNLEHIERNGYQPRQTSKPHAWNIEKGVGAVRTRDVRYYGAAPDKSSWTPEDHDFRFIVSVARAARDHTGHPWSSLAGLKTLVTRAYALKRWLRWIHRPSIGSGQVVKRANEFKQYWMQELSTMRSQETLSTQPLEAMAALDTYEDLAQGHQDPSAAVEANTDVSEGVDPPSHPLSAGYVFDGVTSTSPEASMTSFFNTPVESPVASTQDQPGFLNISVGPCSGRGTSMPAVTSHPRDPMLPNCLSGPADQDHGLEMTLTVNNYDDHPTLPLNDSLSDFAANAIPLTSDSAISLFDDSLFDFTSAIAPFNQQQGIHWLTEEAYVIYKDQLDMLLNSWGVTRGHQGSCVLLAYDWAFLLPEDVVNNDRLEMAIQEEHGSVGLSIGDLTTNWARANAWFAAWPEGYRRARDLEDFLAVDVVDANQPVYGSHTCGHPLCVNPGHVVLETSVEMKSRTACFTMAHGCRTRGVKVPKHCTCHDPPCLLVHAALTSKESLVVQDWVRRLALGHSTNDKRLPLPSDHPTESGPFQYTLPAGFESDPMPMDTAHLFLNTGKTTDVDTTLDLPFSF